MKPIDDTLSEWGSEWRHRQPRYGGQVDFDETRSEGRRLAAWVALPVVGVLAVAAILSANGLMSSQRAGTGASLRGVGGALPVAQGDPVTAIGMIMRRPDDTVEVCLPRASRLMGALACSDISATLEGVSPGDQATWTTTATTNVPKWASVSGMWTGSSIEVARIGAGVPDSGTETEPCEAAAPPSSAESESSIRQLNNLLDAHPALYAGLWRGSSGALVVNTTGDTEAARSEAARIYPYPFCVKKVDRSAAQLEGGAATLAAARPDWSPVVDYATDSVRVLVTVLDEATMSSLKDHADIVFAQPLVRHQ